MKDETLFLAWQDKNVSRLWFPIGRLDVDAARSRFRFRYIRGAEIAREKAGFPTLEDFPDLNKEYRSQELFPLFRNRVITPGRPDFADYLQQLDLPDQADPIEILSVGGGTRATDAMEVFPKLRREVGDTFRCRFFLHGWGYREESARRRLEALRAEEPLYVALELTNPVNGVAVQLQTEDYVMIGWAPRYLVKDIARAVAGGRRGFDARVVRLNPVPAPSRQRLLVELKGPWPESEPMEADEFEPLST